MVALQGICSQTALFGSAWMDAKARVSRVVYAQSSWPSWSLSGHIGTRQVRNPDVRYLASPDLAINTQRVHKCISERCCSVPQPHTSPKPDQCVRIICQPLAPKQLFHSLTLIVVLQPGCSHVQFPVCSHHDHRKVHDYPDEYTARLELAYITTAHAREWDADA